MKQFRLRGYPRTTNKYSAFYLWLPFPLMVLVCYAGHAVSNCSEGSEHFSDFIRIMALFSPDNWLIRKTLIPRTQAFGWSDKGDFADPGFLVNQDTENFEGFGLLGDSDEDIRIGYLKVIHTDTVYTEHVPSSAPRENKMKLLDTCQIVLERLQ